MAETKAGKGSPGAASKLRLTGSVRLETVEAVPEELELGAYVFDKAGQVLGWDEVDAKGHFDVSLDLQQPVEVELVIGPVGEPQSLRRSSAFSRKYAVAEWVGKSQKIFIARDLWWPWRPIRVCISGHVRKVADSKICPVPYAKVEIFDVDREGCWWPHFIKWWELLRDRRVIRLPDLLTDPPFPPKPLPGPVEQIRAAGLKITKPLARVALNPQPEPPAELTGCGEKSAVPGPLPRALAQGTSTQTSAVSSGAVMRVGEMATLSADQIAGLENLTLTSRLAPWHIYRWCFYSKALVCETTTDHKGYFRCCFRWWPFHFRRGRLRFDARPDIIIRVTQVINGVEKVLYLDPYTSTRWDVTNAHIDLWLDNEDIQCGSGDPQERPAGTETFFTRIGIDEVYWINQATGLYARPPLSNMAYGHDLRIFAQFGDALSQGGPARYYRLSYRKGASGDFTVIDTPLSDTRVSKGTLFSETYALGPQTVNSPTGPVTGLFQVRDFAHYYWYNPDWIAAWSTGPVEPDTGLYTLRLEVFDENGVKLTSAQVDYRDGTQPPPAVLPAMTDRCDLIVTVDNKGPEMSLGISAVTLPDCGVIPSGTVPPLNLVIHVAQENGRLYYWGLYYVKGTNPAVNYLDYRYHPTGSPGSVDKTIDAAAAPSGLNMLAGVSTTCAFSLKLYAWAHIRNGYGLVYYDERISSIAIEKCPPCPPCP